MCIRDRLYAVQKIFLNAEEHFNIALNLYESLGNHDVSLIYKNIRSMEMDKKQHGYHKPFARTQIDLPEFLNSLKQECDNKKI